MLDILDGKGGAPVKREHLVRIRSLVPNPGPLVNWDHNSLSMSCNPNSEIVTHHPLQFECTTECESAVHLCNDWE
jgi:hypothetical protein